MAHRQLFSRRQFLQFTAATGATMALAACAPSAPAPAAGGETGGAAAETVKLQYQSRERNAAGSGDVPVVRRFCRVSPGEESGA